MEGKICILGNATHVSFFLQISSSIQLKTTQPPYLLHCGQAQAENQTCCLSNVDLAQLVSAITAYQKCKSLTQPQLSNEKTHHFVHCYLTAEPGTWDSRYLYLRQSFNLSWLKL